MILWIFSSLGSEMIQRAAFTVPTQQTTNQPSTSGAAHHSSAAGAHDEQSGNNEISSSSTGAQNSLHGEAENTAAASNSAVSGQSAFILFIVHSKNSSLSFISLNF